MTFGGATLDEPIQEGKQMKANGSAMLVQAATREEALKVVEGDVYVKSGVWDLSKVRSLILKHGGGGGELGSAFVGLGRGIEG